MGIDKETQPEWLNIVIEDNPQYLKILRAQAEEDGHNESLKKGENKKLCLSMDGHSYDPSEYYFEVSFSKGIPTIEISGELVGAKGKSWVSISMPLSDTVLLDILEHSMKRLGKLKTAMEALK